MIKFSKLIGLMLLIAVTGCASKSRFRTYETEIDSLKRELKFLKEQNSQLRRELDELKKPFTNQEALIRQNKADLATQIEEISRQLEEVQNQLQDTNYRITALMQRSGGFETELVQNENETTAADSTTEENATKPFSVDESRKLYNTAHRDLIRGNYQLALQGFNQFIQQYPNSELADNAQYWIGEVYYAQGRYSTAIEEFEKVVRRYRDGDKRPAALLKIGYAYISLDEIEQGKLYLEDVIKEFPESEEANLAKGRLTSLKR
ncbi:MAG: tol-pal system protein YbgF [bacterium]